MKARATILVVDDDDSYRVALCRMLRGAGFEAQAFASAEALLANISSETSGCVVADLRMPGLNGLELQEALVKIGVPLPVVFLSGQGDIPSSVEAMRRGAIDFLEKRVPQQELIEAVTRALERGSAERDAHTRRQELQERFVALTERERDILRHVVSGRMNKQIAAVLGIHERTVKLHRTSITRKVGVHTVAELTALTRRAGLFESQS